MIERFGNTMFSSVNGNVNTRQLKCVVKHFGSLTRTGWYYRQEAGLRHQVVKTPLGPYIKLQQSTEANMRCSDLFGQLQLCQAYLV